MLATWALRTASSVVPVFCAVALKVVAKPADGAPATSANGHTLGFAAKSYAEVDAFHDNGVAAGGTSEGAPGFRPNSPGNMYGAYLRDPDGNKLCALHRPPTAA